MYGERVNHPRPLPVARADRNERKPEHKVNVNPEDRPADPFHSRRPNDAAPGVGRELWQLDRYDARSAKTTVPKVLQSTAEHGLKPSSIEVRRSSRALAPELPPLISRR